MKNLSLKGKTLAAVAAVLCVVILVATVQMIVAIVGANNPNNAVSSDDPSNYDVVFTGNITLLEEPYEITLKGKDGKFTVDANTMKGVMSGTYTFTEGQGWTFAFNDSLGTNVRSQYDKSAKTHNFIYSLNLGSRGTGNIELSNEDAGFAASDTPWNDIPAFSGTASWFGGTLSADAVCSCDADGNFKIFCTGDEITEIVGTYAVSGNTYTFTTDEGAVYESHIDDSTGLPTFTISTHRPALEAYGPVADSEVVFSLVVLTVD